MKRWLQILGIFAMGIAMAGLMVQERSKRDLRGLETARAHTPESVMDASAEGDEGFETDWLVLRDLDYVSGKRSPLLDHLDGQIVQVPGFVVPLEDTARIVGEFLLVPYAGACIHTPPPPPNQMVHVRMTEGRMAEVSLSVPVWVRGRLRISKSFSPYGEVAYMMRGMDVRPY